ncbi:MAG: AraC family transcriptional regulator [Ferruginibacter sp.]
MITPSGSGKPLVFSYQQVDYEKWLQHFAAHINSGTTNDRLQYPEELGQGYTKARTVEPGLSYRIADYTLHTDLEYKRTPSENFQVILYFYQLGLEDAAYCRIDDKIIESNEKFYSVALMTSSFSSANIIFKKGTRVRGLSVQIEGSWLEQNMKNFELYKLEAAKQKSYIMDLITAKQRKILDDIFDQGDTAHFPELFIKSRVLRLTEQYLTNICKRGLTEIPEFTNTKDFQALLKVENLLLQNYTGQFPSIETLAKTALMSESKLKKLFKKAFGLAPYEYYQKNRMHKAKELLRSRRHSVSQVGSMLGYQNMSNFSAAFKKEFDFLPSQAHEVA